MMGQRAQTLCATGFVVMVAPYKKRQRSALPSSLLRFLVFCNVVVAVDGASITVVIVVAVFVVAVVFAITVVAALVITAVVLLLLLLRLCCPCIINIIEILCLCVW